MIKEVTIGAEKLMTMFIIAMGEFDGNCFVYYPNLPKPFCENINMGKGCVGDLLSLRIDPTDDKTNVQLWFMDDCEEHFFLTWNDVVKIKPTLAAIVFTHIFDMIENLK